MDLATIITAIIAYAPDVDAAVRAIIGALTDAGIDIPAACAKLKADAAALKQPTGPDDAAMAGIEAASVPATISKTDIVQPAPDMRTHQSLPAGSQFVGQVSGAPVLAEDVDDVRVLTLITAARRVQSIGRDPLALVKAALEQ